MRIGTVQDMTVPYIAVIADHLEACVSSKYGSVSIFRIPLCRLWQIFQYINKYFPAEMEGTL